MKRRLTVAVIVGVGVGVGVLCAAPALSAQTQQAPTTYSPLSGIQRPRGGPSGSSGILTSNFGVSQLLDFTSSQNSTSPSSNSNFRSDQAVSGDFAYAAAGQRNDLQFRYSGGAVFYDQSFQTSRTSKPVSRNTSFHQLNVSDGIQFKRFGVLLGDTLDYTPTTFNFGGGIPGIGNLGFIGLGGLNPGLVPQQGLILQGTTRFSNASFVQGDVQLSQRSTITSSASYGFQRYPDFSQFNSRQRVFSEGFDYRVTARMSVALNYDHSNFDYDNLPQKIIVNYGSVGASYQINRSLSVQGSVGPQFIESRTFPDRHNLAGGAALHYIRNHDTVQAYYSRSVNSGSFSILGTQQDLFGIVGNRLFSRNWSGGFTASYTRATGLLGRQNFSNESIGIQTNRKFTQMAGAYLSYTYRHQDSSFSLSRNPSVLAGNSHVIGLGLTFTPRGIRLKR